MLVGRASRAGALGFATNIIDSRNIDLVKSILGLDSEGHATFPKEELPPSGSSEPTPGRASIEKSFSRRRGFRHNIKKQKKRLLANENL